jgi:hypothetical protein
VRDNQRAGSVAERFKAPVLKTGDGQPSVSSNLTASARHRRLEQLHGVGTRLDITTLIADIGERFGGARPTPRQLRSFVVTALGAEVGIALAALIWAMWTYFFPREAKSGQRPSCQWRPAIGARKCGAPLVHVEVTDHGKVLVMICEKGHKVKKAIKP